jgi:hypothetical protein
MANKHISYNSLFLLLLLLPLANSIEDILLNQEITQKELKAVKGDISAVYIIRAIDERAKALKILKNKCRISQV